MITVIVLAVMATFSLLFVFYKLYKMFFKDASKEKEREESTKNKFHDMHYTGDFEKVVTYHDLDS
jgi:hypothetical protein